MFGISKKDFVIITLLNVVWGSAFAIASYGLKYFSTLFLYSMRFLVVGVITVPFFQLSDKKNMQKLAIMGLCQAFTFFGIALGVKHLDSSISAIVTRLDIIFTMAIGIVFFKEKFKIQLVIGTILCLLAVVMLNGEISFANSKYLYLLIFSSLTSGILNIMGKTIKNENNLAIVSWNSYFTGIFLFIASLATEKQFLLQTLDFKAILCFLYMSIFSSYISYLMLYYLLKNNPTTRIMPYAFIRPVVAIFAGLILLGEKITLNKVVAMIIITLGVLISQYDREI
jgi:O-acetylserine/cysteine efflux transporter